MPTALRWGRFRAFFYSNEEGEPAHVHVRAGKQEAKFWLHDLSIAANAGFSAHELGDSLRELKLHRDTLQVARHEHFGD